jgi:hypothetical protein
MVAKKIVVFGVCVSVAIATAALIGHAQEQGKDTSGTASDHPFSGKLLMIHSIDPESSVTIEGPMLQKIADRVFIVGLAVAPRDVWKEYAGKKVWVPVSTASQLWKLSSLDDAKAIYQR